MTATQALALLLFILGSCAIAGLARRRGVAAPILLVLAGLAASYIPGVPTFRLLPDVILFVVLPPLVYTTALESSYLNLRDNVRTLALLSVGLVLFTVAVVGGAAWLAVPGTVAGCRVHPGCDPLPDRRGHHGQHRTPAAPAQTAADRAQRREHAERRHRAHRVRGRGERRIHHGGHPVAAR